MLLNVVPDWYWSDLYIYPKQQIRKFRIVVRARSLVSVQNGSSWLSQRCSNELKRFVHRLQIFSCVAGKTEMCYYFMTICNINYCVVQMSVGTIKKQCFVKTYLELWIEIKVSNFNCSMFLDCSFMRTENARPVCPTY